MSVECSDSWCECPRILKLTQPVYWMRVGRARRAKALLDWETVSTRLPWCAIFVLGGGLALSQGLKVTRTLTCTVGWWTRSLTRTEGHQNSDMY